MRLSALIAPTEGDHLRGEDRDVRGIALDSRAVGPDFLFAALPGLRSDGRAYIQEALERGATAILAPEGDGADLALPEGISLVTTPDARRAVAGIAARFFARQPETIAAVTGTSGKTSTAEFARRIWELLGHASASIGTLGVVAPGGSHYGSLTTPDPVTLHRTLDDLARHHVTHAALEASSHGLELHRLDHVRLKAAGFTNLSRDHLDFHASMEKYLAAKTILFSRLLPPGGVAVLNADAPESTAFRALAEGRGATVLAYGRAGKDLRLLDAQPCEQGQTLRLEVMGRPLEVLLPVAGAFQAWNALCALGLAIGGGADAREAAQALEGLRGVPGRLQKIGVTPSGGSVLVDYAHKPDALEKALAALRPDVARTPGARLFVVFGCGGNRDKGKRPVMGAIAEKGADIVIITDDNPRDEDPATIRTEILAGCARPESIRNIGDRAEAIGAAIRELRSGDVLVIAGKGHEPGQIVGDRVLPFDDAEVARRFLGKASPLSGNGSAGS